MSLTRGAARRNVWLAGVVVAALGGFALFACTVANGLGVPPRSADAAVPPDAGDGCEHKVAPAKPLAPDGVGPNILLALESISFGTKDGGATSLGLDLDGVCTCTAGASTSCIPVAGPDSGKAALDTYCDGPNGQDNAMGVYSENLSLASTSFSLAPFINSRIKERQGGLLIEITGYNGQRDDANVNVFFVPSRGAYRRVDGGGDANDGSAEFVGREDAGNVWSFNGDYVLDAPDGGSQGTLIQGYVKDSTLVAPLQGNIDFAGLPVDFTEGTLMATLVRDENPDGGDPSWHIDDGVVAGRWPIESIASGVGQFSISLAGTRGPICTTFGEIYQSKFLPGLCGAADVTRHKEDDNHNKPCDALSVAMGFTARPAVMGDDVRFGGLEDCSEAGIPPLQCH